jgi:hypothetical protein
MVPGHAVPSSCALRLFFIAIGESLAPNEPKPCWFSSSATGYRSTDCQDARSSSQRDLNPIDSSETLADEYDSSITAMRSHPTSTPYRQQRSDHQTPQSFLGAEDEKFRSDWLRSQRLVFHKDRSQPTEPAGSTTQRTRNLLQMQLQQQQQILRNLKLQQSVLS